MLSMDVGTMTMRYDDGSEQTHKIAMPANIWRSILDEQEAERIRRIKANPS